MMFFSELRFDIQPLTLLIAIKIMIATSTDILTTAYLVKEQGRTLLAVNEEKQQRSADSSVRSLNSLSGLPSSSLQPQPTNLPPPANPFIAQIGDTEDVTVGPFCRAGTQGYDFRGLEDDLIEKMILASHLLDETWVGNSANKNIREVEAVVEEIENFGSTLEALWTSLKTDEEKDGMCVQRLTKVCAQHISPAAVHLTYIFTTLLMRRFYLRPFAIAIFVRWKGNWMKSRKCWQTSGKSWKLTPTQETPCNLQESW
jgi:hypothetical protein